MKIISENIDDNIKPYDLVRHFFPDATDEVCDFILFNRTGYPELFDSKIGAMEHFSRQLEKYRVAKIIGYDVCPCCAMIAELEDELCENCHKQYIKII